MFKEWGFLLTEIWVLLALMALIGLFAGWLIWGRRCQDCDARIATKDDEIRRLRADLDREKSRKVVSTPTPAPMPTPTPEPTPDLAPTPAAAPVVAPEPSPIPAEAKEDAAPSAGVKPEGLDAARNGVPDDLKLIKGVGPKMERLCNSLGYYHFDQIAAWSQSEVAWVDDNLEGFKGRVTRDDWVSQAKVLAAS